MPFLKQLLKKRYRRSWGDDRAESIITQSPRCVLSRGTAAEVGPGEKDTGSLIAGLIQDEFRIDLARIAILVSPIVKEEFSESGPLDSLEELLGDDLAVSTLTRSAVRPSQSVS